MLAIPSELYIQKRVGLPAFKRGKEYFQRGAIFDARVQGDALLASCKGTQSQPYQLRVLLDERRVLSAVCSCPIGAVGRCKHMAALLLAWRHRPWDFHQVAALDASLAALSHERLVSLLLEVFRLHPELEWLVEQEELLGEALPRREVLSAETFRRRAEALLRAASPERARSLSALRALGERFLQERAVTSAAQVFDGLLCALLRHEREDEDSELAAAIASISEGCVAGLGRCLAMSGQDARVRMGAVRALFFACRVGIEQGASRAGDEAAALLLEHTSAEERALVGQWLRHALGASTGLAREQLGRFLLRIEAPILDEAGVLAIAHAAGLVLEVVERLLASGRKLDALAEAQRADNAQLLAVASALERAGLKTEARRLVERRGGDDASAATLDWLRARVRGRGKEARALGLAERAFRASPSLSRLQALRTLSGQEWPALREPLVCWLQEQGRAGLLTELLLDEGQLERAAEVLRGELSTPPAVELRAQLRLRLARAAESARPDLAIECYRVLVDEAIEARGREHYRRACSLLRAMGRAFAAQGDSGAFEVLVEQLRAQHHNLRAFLDELDAAGLGRTAAPALSALARKPWSPLKATPRPQPPHRATG